MRPIVIDGDMLCDSSMNGMHRYMYEIIRRLDKLVKDLDVRIVLKKNRNIKNLQLENIKVINLDTSDLLYRIVAVRKYVKESNAIYISMNNGYIPCKDSIATLHDVIPLHKECNYSIKSKLHMKLIYNSIKSNADKIVTVSKTSKAEIATKLIIDESRISIIGNGYEHFSLVVSENHILDKYEKLTTGNYYLSLGNKYPYKNIEWICENAINYPDNVYVVCGDVGASIKDKYKSINNIIFLEEVKDEEYKALMENAKAFVMPTKLEGFGIPPLEALSLGTKVIVSNIPVFLEIYKDYVYFIEPDKSDTNLNQLLENSKVKDCEELLKKYSWDESARKWNELIRQSI